MNLSQSVFDFRMIVFTNNIDRTKAITAVIPNMSTIGAGGEIITSNNNVGSFGLSGSLTNSGKTITVQAVGYIAHLASSNHSKINNDENYKIDRIFGMY